MIPREIPPVPPDIAALLDAERHSGDAPPHGAEKRIFERLQGSIGAGALPASGLAWPGLAKGLVVLAVAVGAGGVMLLGRGRPKPAISHAAPPVTPVVGGIGRTAAASQAVVPQDTSPSVRVGHAERDPPEARDSDLARERVLLDAARRALARRDGAGALHGLRRHEQIFPEGRLTEEREGMWIHALLLAGRPAEAHARAELFRRRFPGSVFRPAIERALRAAP